MIRNFISCNRTECTKPDMQRNELNFYAHIFYFLKQLFCKVQASRRRSSRTDFPRIDSLIAFLIFKFFLNIGRQRHLTNLVKDSKEISTIVKVNNPIAVILHSNHFCGKQTFAECEMCPGLCTFAGLAEDLPSIIPVVC